MGFCIFITEAIWTRYMPLSLKINELLKDDVIGEPRLLNASLCYQMEFKERILRPDLCGGALLDLGVYVIHFARMYFGGDVLSQTSSCIKGVSGMDMHNNISWSYRDGRMTNLQSSAFCLCSCIWWIKSNILLLRTRILILKHYGYRQVGCRETDERVS